MISMPKALNCLALILLLLHSTSCSTLRKANAKAESSLSKWDPKWQFDVTKGSNSVYFYSTKKRCQSQGCIACYTLDAWKDLRNNISYHDSQKNFYICLYQRKVSRKTSDPKKPKESNKLWKYQDLCNAYCQPIYDLKCSYNNGKDGYVC
jgi:hypothetical protein